jgi:replicative DNA helicase
MKTHSLEAEQHLLACALIDENVIPSLLEIPEDHFYRNEHRLIYRAISELAHQELTVDFFSVGELMQQKQQIEIIGGMEYLQGLGESLPSVGMFKSFAGSMLTHYKMRQLIQIKDSLEQQLETGSKPAESVEWLQGAVIDLLTDHHKGGIEGISKHMDSALEYIDWKAKNNGAIIGSKSGYDQLDYMLDGFQNGLLYAICARPAMGKTMFAMSLAHRFAMQVPVCFFSLEMTGSMLSQRLIAAESKVSTKSFKAGTVSGDQMNDVAMAVTRIHELSKLHVDETAGLTVAQIRSRLKAFQMKHGKVGAVFVDHIGLIQNRQGASSYDGLTETVHELQRMAKEFNCPLIMISQLNRNCETRTDKRPMMADIRQTGAIEEDCRGVMFVYRDEYYEDNSQQKNITELIVAKNSMGETGTLYYHHDLSVGLYEEIEDYTAPEPEPKKKGGGF